MMKKEESIKERNTFNTPENRGFEHDGTPIRK